MISINELLKRFCIEHPATDIWNIVSQQDAPTDWSDIVSHIEYARNAFSFNALDVCAAPIQNLGNVIQRVATTGVVQKDELEALINSGARILATHYGYCLLSDMYAGAVYASFANDDVSVNEGEYKELLTELPAFGYPIRCIADGEARHRELQRLMKLKITLMEFDPQFHKDAVDYELEAMDLDDTMWEFFKKGDYKLSGYRVTPLIDAVEYMTGKLSHARRGTIEKLFDPVPDPPKAHTNTAKDLLPK